MKKYLSLLLLTGLLAGCQEEPVVVPDPLLSVSDATLPEGSTTTEFVFRVRLSAAAPREVTFTYSTLDNTAKAGEDYTAVTSGTGTIPVGATETTLTVTGLGDEIKEADETFRIALANLVNSAPSKTTATGTIINDDTQILIPETGYTTPTTYPGYTLAWQDEFNGTSLDLTSWTYEIGDGCPNVCGWGNNELEYYTDRPENLYFTQGKMVIEAIQESFGGKSYTSTRIKTQGKKSFKYGRIDIRAILPEGQGIWPALWMLGDNINTVNWPACGEIDIMELVGNQPSTTHSTVHFGPNFNNHQYRGASKSLTGGKFIDEFHVFSLNWEENLLEFYVDDVKFYTVTPTTTQGFTYPFNNPFFFIFNVAVGGNWPGSPNSTTVFPQRMIVDYVRVFQKN
ncbi:MAG: family 16 glycosylhydrolase [Bacteroidia bacterium]|nr:family 16 glycosylhydrolase [Bacteroidia bacterium]